MKPRLVDVSKLDADINVDRPDVSPSRIRRHHVLEQCFATLHRTVTEFQLCKLADHLDLWTQQKSDIPTSVLLC